MYHHYVNRIKCSYGHRCDMCCSSEIHPEIWITGLQISAVLTFSYARRKYGSFGNTWAYIAVFV
jgi:hypothetical protein